jgi:hypothetical protein
MPVLISETDVMLEHPDRASRVSLCITERPRAHGLHLSGLLRYVAGRSRVSARVSEAAEEVMPLRWAMGQAWEEYAVSLMPHVTWQPYECLSPVIMNCDGISFEGADILLHEFKFNRSKKYSGRDLIQRKWLWMCQGMGYCLGYGTNRVEWNVLSCMEWPDPVWTRYLIEFDQEELDGMFNMIQINKDAAIEAGYAE